MNRVDGKVALVTGAARGIGAETAKLLAKAGAKVAVTDILDSGEQVAADIRADGGEAIFVHHDATSEEDWKRATRETFDKLGGFEILVNNAGIYMMMGLEEMTLDDWRRVSSINLDGVFLGTKYAVQAMKYAASKGVPCGASRAIVNLSSVAGIIGMPLGTAYHMSKGGVRLFTKSAALECARLGYNIRVNSIHPGLIETDMGSEVMRRVTEKGLIGSANDAHAAFLAMHPIGRLGQAMDIARGILFLASDDSSFMTGSELVVDGGFTAQ
jgi:NAD(P)-dependent dehydrogenase (short-subunit alcohol dehydrogenase family)